MKIYRPGILASRAKRIADAHLRSAPLMSAINEMGSASISEIVRRLNEAGYRAARGGLVSYNTVKRAIARAASELPDVCSDPRSRRSPTSKSLRARAQRYEAFRTPAYAFTPLLDYCPHWFQGRGFDPCAGDGRMISEIIRRGNAGPHYLNDIRPEELPKLLTLGHATSGDYLAMRNPPTCDFLITNPPFSKAMLIVEKARRHISGPVCILQSIAWQSTRRRSEWLRDAGLGYVLNLPRRPRWEVDSGDKVANNIWDYAWFIFLPDHTAGTMMDWLSEAL